MTHTKEELQAIYFGFYDQLPEPWRSEAKERWDYEFAKKYSTPKNVCETIAFGWDWRKKNEERKWRKIHDILILGEIPLNTPDLQPSTPTLSDIKKQLDRIEELLNKLIEKQ